MQSCACITSNLASSQFPFVKHTQVVIDPAQVVTTKNGARFVTVKQGACPLADFEGKLGSCFPAPGKYAILDYTAFLPTGEVFDTTEKKGGKPLAFRIGENQVCSLRGCGTRKSAQHFPVYRCSR